MIKRCNCTKHRKIFQSVDPTCHLLFYCTFVDAGFFKHMHFCKNRNYEHQL